MNLKELRNKKWFKVISNKYVLLILIFGGWMFFLDSNSWLIHNELNQEIEELEENRQYYKNEISKDKATIEQLQDSVEMEKFARQQYYMKRPDEEIFIIEYDTITE
ncbi:FtsB family cell division protein [Salegentibacter salarius]|uniref:Septum formation initiator n=1 Tax=Salegentibacter salarius TaxID=435906 RepID=A0A2N0U4X9_9FLAO|nr:septum formation initiator family protein [Salegentibacter salarius]OEY73866.1 septum formation initiator [Salegentibacter salarius]PKD22067.1 septum formation initiator [Salegentibacter salarius]